MNELQLQYQKSVDKFCDDQIKLLPMAILQAQANTEIVVRQTKKRKFIQNAKSFLPIIIAVILLGFVFYANFPKQKLSDNKPVITSSEEKVIHVDDDTTTKPVSSTALSLDKYPINIALPYSTHYGEDYYEPMNIEVENNGFKATLVSMSGSINNPNVEFLIEILDENLAKRNSSIVVNANSFMEYIHDSLINRDSYPGESAVAIRVGNTNKYIANIPLNNNWIHYANNGITEITYIELTNTNGEIEKLFVDIDFNTSSTYNEYYPHITNYYDNNHVYFEFGGTKYNLDYIEMDDTGVSVSFSYRFTPGSSSASDSSDDKPKLKGWYGFISSFTLNADGETIANDTIRGGYSTYYNKEVDLNYGTLHFPAIDLLNTKQLYLEYTNDVTCHSIDSYSYSDNIGDSFTIPFQLRNSSHYGEEYNQVIDQTLETEDFKLSLNSVSGGIESSIVSMDIEILDKELARYNSFIGVKITSFVNNYNDYSFLEDDDVGYLYTANRVGNTNIYHLDFDMSLYFADPNEFFTIYVMEIDYKNGQEKLQKLPMHLNFVFNPLILDYYPHLSTYINDTQGIFKFDGNSINLFDAIINQDFSQMSFKVSFDKSKISSNISDVTLDHYAISLWNNFAEALVLDVDGQIYTSAGTYSDHYLYEPIGKSACYGTILFPGIDLLNAKEIKLVFDTNLIENYQESNTQEEYEETSNTIEEDTTIDETVENDSNVSDDTLLDSKTIIHYYITFVIIFIIILALIIIFTFACISLPMNYTLLKLQNNYYNMYGEYATGYNSNTFNNRVSSLREIQDCDGLFAIEVDARDVSYTGFDVSSDGMLCNRLSRKERLFELCNPENQNKPTMYASKYRVKLYSGEEIECLIDDLIVDIPISGSFVLPIGRLNDDGIVDCYSDFIYDHYKDGTIDTKMNIFKRISITIVYIIIAIKHVFKIY